MGGGLSRDSVSLLSTSCYMSSSVAKSVALSQKKKCVATNTTRKHPTADLLHGGSWFALKRVLKLRRFVVLLTSDTNQVRVKGGRKFKHAVFLVGKINFIYI